MYECFKYKQIKKIIKKNEEVIIGNAFISHTCCFIKFQFKLLVAKFTKYKLYQLF